MRKILHKERDRGEANHGWLHSRFSFSFADWHDPSRMGYGRLRVINDDEIAPLGKFGMHPHKDFEIITIPLEGSVTHEDSLGNIGTVAVGEVQAMSAGTGVLHSEFNASDTERLSLFQIWIEPHTPAATPRYAQRRFDPSERQNSWQILVSSDGVSGSLPIYQNARIAWVDIDSGNSITYAIAHKGNGVYFLVVEGEVEIEGEPLSRRDAIGISETDSVSISATIKSSVLVIEVPIA